MGDDMSNVELEDGSEEAAKVEKKIVISEPDSSAFDNEVANGLGIPVDSEDKSPEDVA
jgi:hypothetical protein